MLFGAPCTQASATEMYFRIPILACKWINRHTKGAQYCSVAWHITFFLHANQGFVGTDLLVAPVQICMLFCHLLQLDQGRIRRGGVNRYECGNVDLEWMELNGCANG